MSIRSTTLVLLCLAMILIGCDTTSDELATVETVILPPIDEFDRIVVLVPLYNPAFAVEITSSDIVGNLHEFLESHQSDWLVPSFGTYNDGTRVELYAGDELVDVLYVGESHFDRYYFARDFGEIHVRRVDKEEVMKLEKVLGTGVRTVGHP